MLRLIISLYRAMGAGVAIGVMEILATIAQEPVSRVPFVTSIVLVMALPDSPPAQPRALVGGHFLSCVAGWLSQHVLGPGPIASAVGVGGATFAMIVTGTLHPPAGIDAFLIPAENLPVRWILTPVMVGTLLLAVFAKVWALGERVLFHRSAGDASEPVRPECGESHINARNSR